MTLVCDTTQLYELKNKILQGHCPMALRPNSLETQISCSLLENVFLQRMSYHYQIEISLVSD
jgi:hypothetical protein